MKNCFGCVGLRNVEYYFFNQKCTKEEYEEKIRNVDISTHEKLLEMKRIFIKKVSKYPHRASVILNSENVLGDYIADSKNVYNSFDIEKVKMLLTHGVLNLQRMFMTDVLFILAKMFTIQLKF